MVSRSPQASIAVINNQKDACKALFALSWPICLSSLLHPLSGSVTAVWIGRYLGEIEFSACLNANFIFGLLVGILSGLANAASILISQKLGSATGEDAKQVVWLVVPFQLICIHAVALLGFATAPSLLQLIGASPSELAIGSPYLRALMFAMVPISVMQLLNAILRGTGDTKTGLKITFAAVILDTLLNPLLIFGFGPLKPLGLLGTGIALLCAYSVCCCILILLIVKRRDPIFFPSFVRGIAKRNLSTIRWIVSKGLALGAQNIVIIASGLVIVSFANEFGSAATAAFAAAQQVWGYVLIPSSGIAMGTTTLAAHAFGSRNLVAVGKILRAGILLGLSLTLVTIFLAYLLNDTLLQMFLPEGSAALPIAANLNATVLWSLALYAFNGVVLSISRAAGFTLGPLVVTFATIVVFRSSISAMVAPFGVNYLWGSINASVIVWTICTIIYFRIGKWRSHLN